VWWSLITMTKASDQNAWNDALREVAAERPNLTLWDWPRAQQQHAVPLAATASTSRARRRTARAVR
jgi:hypothetical protein